ncbi:MAG: hypothetical protein ACRBB4_03475 [Neptuniibacter sp.]
MLNKKALCLVLSASFLAGCAGSANHEVVTAYNASDDAMTCNQLTAEQVRVQAIINAVNQDKDDVKGKDLLDGILWFPFNLIAKNSNYKESLNAANTRLTRIDYLRKDKSCSDEQLAEAEKNIEKRLEELKDLKERQLITEEEYIESRKSILTRG